MLFPRLSEVEKTTFRRANDGALMALWHKHKNELFLQGLDDEQGFQKMVEVKEQCFAVWAEQDKNPGFGRTWLF